MPWIQLTDISTNAVGYYSRTTPTNPAITRVAARLVGLSGTTPQQYGYVSVWGSTVLPDATIEVLNGSYSMWGVSQLWLPRNDAAFSLSRIGFYRTFPRSGIIPVRLYYFTP